MGTESAFEDFIRDVQRIGYRRSACVKDRLQNDLHDLLLRGARSQSWSDMGSELRNGVAECHTGCNYHIFTSQKIKAGSRRSA